MCIRDSVRSARIGFVFQSFHLVPRLTAAENIALPMTLSGICLLYTSDAADERSSVDLGGRRIIKKKTNAGMRGWSARARQEQYSIAT